MNSVITTLEATPTLNAKTILQQDGFHCSLLTLEPGDETPRLESADGEEHLVYVVQGEATAQVGDICTLLRQGQAQLIPHGRPHVISGGPRGAKILRVVVPPRQIVTPQIISVDR